MSAAQNELNEILNHVDQTMKTFDQDLAALSFTFQTKMSSLKGDISRVLNRQTNKDEYFTLSLDNIMERIRLQGSDSPSRILCMPNSALSDPSSFTVPVVCTDGSLQFANSHRSAAYAISYGSHLPHLDFACGSLDTSSTTIVEIQGISHAISSAVTLGLSSLVVFCDSIPAINLSTVAILCGLHQNKHISRLAHENKVFKKVFQALHSNSKRFRVLCILHVKAHETITDFISATNALVDNLSKEECKANLLARLPSNSVRPRIIDLQIPVTIPNDHPTSLLSY